MVLADYPDVSLEHVAVDDTKAFELQMAYEAYYETENPESLKLFVGHVVLCGKTEVEARLEAVLQEEIAKGNRTPSPGEVKNATAQHLTLNTKLSTLNNEEKERSEHSTSNCVNAKMRKCVNEESNRTSNEEKEGFEHRTSNIELSTSNDERTGSPVDQRIRGKFEQLTVWMVILAGLGDGVNPCAFVTLVFFISVLTQLRKSKSDILKVGLTFSASVFVTYLLIGLGILAFVKQFSVQNNWSLWLNRAVGGFVLILAILTLLDLWRMRQPGQERSMRLKLPLFIRKRMNRLIRTQMSSKQLIWGAVVTGVGISLLESACTGQVYLPVILYVLKQGGSWQAVGYLLLYNLMFIVPLLAVFILAWGGVTSARITQFFNDHLFLSKGLMFLLFLVLGLILLIG